MSDLAVRVVWSLVAQWWLLGGQAGAGCGGSLTRSNKVVRDLSDRLASSALDESLSSEVEELWGDIVAPVLNRMESTVRVPRLASGVVKRSFGDALAALKTGSVTVAVSSLMATGATSYGIAASGTYVLGTALEEAVEARKAAQAHEFLYLANLDRGLWRLR